MSQYKTKSKSKKKAWTCVEVDEESDNTTNEKTLYGGMNYIDYIHKIVADNNFSEFNEILNDKIDQYISKQNDANDSRDEDMNSNFMSLRSLCIFDFYIVDFLTHCTNESAKIIISHLLNCSTKIYAYNLEDVYVEIYRDLIFHALFTKDIPLLELILNHSQIEKYKLMDKYTHKYSFRDIDVIWFVDNCIQLLTSVPYDLITNLIESSSDEYAIRILDLYEELNASNTTSKYDDSSWDFEDILKLCIQNNKTSIIKYLIDKQNIQLNISHVMYAIYLSLDEMISFLLTHIDPQNLQLKDIDLKSYRVTERIEDIKNKYNLDPYVVIIGLLSCRYGDIDRAGLFCNRKKYSISAYENKINKN